MALILSLVAWEPFLVYKDDVPEPLPSPVFLLETFLGPARKSAHPGLLLDGTFFMSLYIILNFRRLKVSIIIYIVPHFLVYSYTDCCICVKQTIIFTLFQITVNNIHHVHCTFRTDWLYLLVWTVLSHQNSQVWTWSCLSLPFMWSLFSWSKVNFK